jgi:hypothetical protein
MNTPILLFGLPGSLLFFGMAFLIVVGGLVYYALFSKGDVRAEFSYGKTLFKLEAKEAKLANDRARSVRDL